MPPAKTTPLKKPESFGSKRDPMLALMLRKAATTIGRLHHESNYRNLHSKPGLPSPQ